MREDDAADAAFVIDDDPSSLGAVMRHEDYAESPTLLSGGVVVAVTGSRV